MPALSLHLGAAGHQSGVEIPLSQALFMISFQSRYSPAGVVLFLHFTDEEGETQVA